MARIYIVSSSLFVKGRLFAAARLEEERDDQHNSGEKRMSKKVKPTPCPHCKTEHFLTKHGKFPPHQCRPGQRCPMSSQRAAQ